MKLIATIKDANNVEIEIKLGEHGIEKLIKENEIDGLIISTEDGFSPLGLCKSFISRDLGIPVDKIKELADWNRFKNPNVSLVCLRSRRTDSHLKGVILAASETSECYKKFAKSFYGRPYRDFYYNVTYEAIKYLNAYLHARSLGISHLSGSGNFHKDIATCNIEAFDHYIKSNLNENVSAFTFFGCCIEPDHFNGVDDLIVYEKKSVHRNIDVKIHIKKGFEILDLFWTVPSSVEVDEYKLY